MVKQVQTSSNNYGLGEFELMLYSYIEENFKLPLDSIENKTKYSYYCKKLLEKGFKLLIKYQLLLMMPFEKCPVCGGELIEKKLRNY
jgi:rRNA maturation endonuclease Nob1